MHTGGRIFGRRGFCPPQPRKTRGPQDSWQFARDSSCKSGHSRHGRIVAGARQHPTQSEDGVDASDSGSARDDGPSIAFGISWWWHGRLTCRQLSWMNWRKIWSPQFLPQVRTPFLFRPQGLFAAGVVENTPTMHEAGGVSEGAAPQVLPATFALDAEDTESSASRTSAVSHIEDVGGGGPLNNRRPTLVWDRDQGRTTRGTHCCESDQDVGHPSWGSATRWRHTRDNQATTVVPTERSLDVGGPQGRRRRVLWWSG